MPQTEEGESTFGEEGDAVTGHYEMEEFWEPSEQVEDLYDQLWQRKYREIPQKHIVWVCILLNLVD